MVDHIEKLCGECKALGLPRFRAGSYRNSHLHNAMLEIIRGDDISQDLQKYFDDFLKDGGISAGLEVSCFQREDGKYQHQIEIKPRDYVPPMQRADVSEQMTLRLPHIIKNYKFSRGIKG